MSKAVWDYTMALLMSCLSAWILKEYLRTFLGKGKTMVFTIVYNSIWMLLEIVLVFIFTAIELNDDVQGLLRSLVSKVLLFMIVEVLKHFFGNKNSKELPYSYHMILLLIPLGSMLVVYSSYLMSLSIQSSLRIFGPLLGLGIILLINFLIFTIYLKRSEDLELHQKNMIYKEEIDLYNKHMQETENYILEFRKARYDLRNQLLLVLEQCEKKEYVKLERFWKQLMEKAPLDTSTIAQTDNLIVDVLVNNKCTIARQYGIAFTAGLDIPMNLPFNNADLCIILGNILDNALEANIRSGIEKQY